MSRLYTHKPTLDYLIGLHNKSKLNNQYIFSGPEGVGKKKTAIELSKRILNTDYYLTHPDFMILEREKTIKVNDISECIKFLSEKPISSDKKVLIIDNAELMNVYSANKFLKTFEDTPEYTHVFLITSNKNELLETIISRAVIIEFSRNSFEDITSYLSSDYEDDYAYEIASIARGSIGFAHEIINDHELYNVINAPLDLIQSIIDGRKTSIVEISSTIGDDYVETFLNNLQYFFRDIFMIKLDKNAELVYYANKRKILENNSIFIKKDVLGDVIKTIEDAKNKIRANCNKHIVLYATMLNIYEELK